MHRRSPKLSRSEAAREHLTILHLSDPQFGKNHRFGSEEPFDTLFERLAEDLRQLRAEKGLAPDLVVLTGDLAEWGLKSEFEQALDFLVRLCELLELGRDRVAVIPGNHDVNRAACEAYFKQCEGDEQTPLKPYWPKWKHYVWLFESCYRDCPGVRFTEEEPWSLFEMPDLRVVVAGLNSTMAESHLDGDHYGWVGEPQLRWFRERLEGFRNRGWLRIGAVHHNVVRGAVNDDENLRDAPLMRQILDQHLNLVLHGHTHRGALDWWRPELPLISTGSAALNKDALPEEFPNQYQFLHIWPDRLCRWSRQYALDQKRWIADPRVSRSGNDGFEESHAAFEHVEATFEGAERKARDLEKFYFESQDDFLSRLEAITKLRYERAEIRRVVTFDLEYFSVTALSQGRTLSFPLAGTAIATQVPADLAALFEIHDRYRRPDPQAVAYFVYGGDLFDESLVEEAWKHGVRLLSSVEYQGLIDFRPYVQRQTSRLEADPRYPPALYVPQRLRHAFGQEESEGDAFESVSRWLSEPNGRFVLILGDFGTGKSFLLRELARRFVGGPVPVLIEMRELEKGRGLNELVAQHLARAGMDKIDLPAFRYMLRQGRIALLFDGFDELALRVTYERATEHFKTLLEAAQGEAKVVVTSRTTHFESEKQVKTALMEKVELLAGQRVAHLRPFDREQIRRFLIGRLGSESAADARLALLDGVKDLLGLSANPRMLGFICELPDEDLLAAKARTGTITAAGLYQMLLDRWLGFETERQEPRGALPALQPGDRWQVVTQLALRLWRKTESYVDVSELTAEVSRCLTTLAERQLSPAQAAHQVGSGTLLVRDAEGAFSFIHQSVLEWLVASTAARSLTAGEPVETLGFRPISPLMADFFNDLAGREQAVAWARAAVGGEAGEIARNNALLLLGRLGETVAEPLRLAGEDLRGRDFSGQDLSGADFELAQLASARFVKSQLRGARFRAASLVGADLTEADLGDSDLTRADLTAAKLLGANLEGASLAEAILTRAKLVGARLADTELGQAQTFGAALSANQGLTASWLGTASCTSVAWHPAGDLLACGYQNGIVAIWESSTGQVVRTLAGHGSAVLSVAWSPDGQRLASGSKDRTVRLWGVAGGSAVRTLAGHGSEVLSVAWSPDGQRLVSGSGDHTVRLWEVAGGSAVRTLEGHGDAVRSVAWSPDGQRLASGSGDGTVQLWEVAGGSAVRTLEGHGSAVWSVAWSPDGQMLVSGSLDRTVRLWEVAGGSTVRTLEGHRAAVLSVAWSPEGQRLASGSLDGMVRLWEVAGGSAVRTLEGHGSAVWSVAWSPDGQRLASSSGAGTVRLWEVAGGSAVRTLEGHGDAVRSVAWSPDGQRLVSGSGDGTVRLWEVAGGSAVRTLEGHGFAVLSVAWSPDGQRLASGSGDGTVRLWEVAGGSAVRTLEGHGDAVWSVAWSPEGQRLASGSEDGTVRLWEVAGGSAVRTLEGHGFAVLSVAWSPEGQRLASGSDDGTVQLWEVAGDSAVRTLEGHEDWVRSVAWSPDGQLLASGSDDHTVRLWEVAGGSAVRTLEGHGDWVLSVAWSPDGQLLASSSDDGTVRLWEVAGGSAVRTLEGHGSAVLNVAWSPDVQRLASASDDGTLRLWHAATGTCLAILLPLPEGWVAFTPDGRYKLGGHIAGGFWHTIGLCRFEPGELDPYLPQPLRIPDDEPLIPELAGR